MSYPYSSGYKTINFASQISHPPSCHTIFSDELAEPGPSTYKACNYIKFTGSVELRDLLQSVNLG